MSNDLVLDIDIYALPKACIFCDEEAGQFELCGDHLAEFINWKSDGNVTDWLAFKIRKIREKHAVIVEDFAEAVAAIDAECDHLRKRAREFKDGKINGYALANSVLKHVDLISKEPV